MNIVKAIVVTLVFAVTGGCESPWTYLLSSPSVQAQPNTITVLTTSSIWTYQHTKMGAWGFEHDVLSKFGKAHNYKFKFKVHSSSEDARRAFLEGKGQVLSIRNNQSTFGSALVSPAIDSGRLSLVCDKSTSFNSISKIQVPLGRASSFLGFSLFQIFEKKIELSETRSSSFELMKDLKKKGTGCAILDASESQYYLALIPSLTTLKTFNLQVTTSLLVRSSEQKLFSELSRWIKSSYLNHELHQTRSNYSAQLSALKIQDRIRVKSAMRTQLKDLLPLFKAASSDFDLPWHLVASVAYQESHWNDEAVSYTGVKGIMQLTQATANYLGVFDRTDKALSLWGGSKYLRYLFSKTNPNSLTRDRLALALASYNIGVAHVSDLQNLAIERGLDPDSWIVIHDLLALKANPRWASRFKFGSARGHETQQFVLRVLGYLDIFTLQ